MDSYHRSLCFPSSMLCLAEIPLALFYHDSIYVTFFQLQSASSHPATPQYHASVPFAAQQAIPGLLDLIIRFIREPPEASRSFGLTAAALLS